MKRFYFFNQWKTVLFKSLELLIDYEGWNLLGLLRNLSLVQNLVQSKEIFGYLNITES